MSRKMRCAPVKFCHSSFNTFRQNMARAWNNRIQRQLLTALNYPRDSIHLLRYHGSKHFTNILHDRESSWYCSNHVNNFVSFESGSHFFEPSYHCLVPVRRFFAGHSPAFENIGFSMWRFCLKSKMQSKPLTHSKSQRFTPESNGWSSACRADALPLRHLGRGSRTYLHS